MARTERPLDSLAGQPQAFAAELREQAGNPRYLQMARQSGKSRTALAEAAGGDHLPTWETVEAFVRACGGEPAQWRVRRERVRDEVRDGRRPTAATHEEAGSEEPSASPPVASSTSRRWLPVAMAVSIALGTGAAVGFGFSRMHNDDKVADADPRAASTVITVQNKVAMGRDRLMEDSTPAYLSAKAAPYCARDGCKVAGTEMASGAKVVAVCHAIGTEMFNYNLDSAESRSNPNGADSALWYRVVWPDGRAGYLAEVYVVPADRGGKSLKACS